MSSWNLGGALMFAALILPLGVTLLTLLADSRQSAAWPAIEPVRAHKTFLDADKPYEDKPFFLDIKGKDGTILYKLECHDGDHEGGSVILFSGTYHCVLYAVSGSTITSWNLLAEDTPAQQRSDWLNRGRFMANQLREPCASSAEYGPSRSFRLRGLRLTLRIADIQWAPATAQSAQKLRRFTFHASVDADASATSATAMKPDVPAPPRECF